MVRQVSPNAPACGGSLTMPPKMENAMEGRDEKSPAVILAKVVIASGEKELSSREGTVALLYVERARPLLGVLFFNVLVGPTFRSI